jgi:putative transposase
MHRNPVKRGLADTPEAWPWSSYHHYQTTEPGRVEIESEWTWNRRERDLSIPS